VSAGKLELPAPTILQTHEAK